MTRLRFLVALAFLLVIAWGAYMVAADRGAMPAVEFVAGPAFDGNPTDRRATAYISKEQLVIQLQDYFHSAGELKRPRLAVRNGVMTAILEVSDVRGSASSRCEFQRKIRIAFPLSVENGARLAVYNTDTGEELPVVWGAALSEFEEQKILQIEGSVPSTCGQISVKPN